MSFHNGEAFNAAAVKYSFERAADKTSTNKDKAVHANITGINPCDPAKARALLHRAGITPPLAKVGIKARIENADWAQWLSGVYGQKACDLTVISHAEPLDFGNFARPKGLWKDMPLFASDLAAMSWQ